MAAKDYSRLVFERLSVDAFGWDAVTAPSSLSRVHLKNLGPEDVLVRTDQDDSGTQDTIPVGGGENFRPERLGAYRKDDVICYLQSSGATSVVRVTWST